MYSLLLGLIVLLLVVLSVRQRMLYNFKKQSRGCDIDFKGGILSEAKTSPVSSALAGLIGTAGGIYLSIVMLTSFLEMEIPARVQVWQFELEPLAAISILIALIQPFVLSLIKRD